MPKNQTAWNSDNHGIKETVKQNNQAGKVADGEKLLWGGGPWGRAGCGEMAGCVSRADLRGNWDSEVAEHYGGCHDGRNSQSHTRESSLKSELEVSRWAARFPLGPLPHRQGHSAGRRVALTWWIPKALPPYNLAGAPSKEIWPKWKNRAKPQKQS